MRYLLPAMLNTARPSLRMLALRMSRLISAGLPQSAALTCRYHIYPDFSDRTSPNVWEEQGKAVLLNQAIEKTRDILAHHVPRHVSDEVDAQMRAEFPIFLSRAAMGR